MTAPRTELSSSAKADESRGFKPGDDQKLDWHSLETPPRNDRWSKFYPVRPMLAASAAARRMLDDISLVTVLCSSTATAVEDT